MFSILIVDDDFLARAQLKALMDYTRYGYRIVAEAKNGDEAIQLIEMMPPDIVITDINMPNGNGIMLIEHIRIHYPAIAVIALSAYDNFEYVRDGLKHGAQDYLLKHSLTEQMLLRVLGEATAQMEPLKDMPADPDRERQQFLREYLRATNNERDYMIASLPTAAFRMNGNYLCVSIACAVPPTAPANAKRREPAFLAQSVFSVVRDSLDDVEAINCLCLDTQILVFFFFGTLISRKGVHQQIEAHFGRIQQNVRLFLNVKVYFGVSELYAVPEMLATASEEARERMSLRFYEPDTWIFRSTSERGDGHIEITADDRRELASAIGSASVERYQKWLKQIFADIKTRRFRYSRVQSFCYMFMKELEQLASAYGVALDRDEYIPFVRKEAETNIMEIESWFRALGEHIIKSIPLDRVDRQYSMATKGALQFIMDRYSDDISLRDAAKYVSFNASYLSRVFKEETGQNFVGYLNEYRINRAIEILTCGAGRKQPLGEVAGMVGFNSYNHFLSLFKKIAGCSPETYRSRQ